MGAGLAALSLVAAIGVREAIKWFFEWVSLRKAGSVEESRGARRLRRLQQAVQEEVARYGLDEGEFERMPTSPMASSTRVTPRPCPLRRSEAEPSTTRVSGARPVTTAVAAVQTDFDDGYRPFAGPFVVSEHGDRVHHEPTCHGLRNAMTRRRQLQLRAYCQGRQQLFHHVG